MNCTIKETHCHDANDKCIGFIEDCETHFDICFDGCHEECACMDFES